MDLKLSLERTNLLKRFLIFVNKVIGSIAPLISQGSRKPLRLLDFRSISGFGFNPVP
jgi:hypothetical protein